MFGHDTVYTKYMGTSGNTSDLYFGGAHLPWPRILLVFLSVVGGYQNFLGTSCLHLQGLNDFCCQDGDSTLVPPTRLCTRRQTERCIWWY